MTTLGYLVPPLSESSAMLHPREDAPSYFIECLLYNVPNHLFKRIRAATYTSILAWLVTAKLNGLKCHNGKVPLFGKGREQWTVDRTRALAKGLQELWETGGGGGLDPASLTDLASMVSTQECSTRWAIFDDIQKRLRTVAGKFVNLWSVVGSTTKVAHCGLMPLRRRLPTMEASSASASSCESGGHSPNRCTRSPWAGAIFLPTAVP